MHFTGKYQSNFAQRLSISTIVLLLVFTAGFAQEPAGCYLRFAKDLFQKGYSDEAITEYYRAAFKAEDNKTQATALLGVGLCYRELGLFDKALHVFQCSMRLVPAGDSLREKISLAVAVTHVAGGQINRAQLDLLMMTQTSPYPSIRQEASLLLLTSAIIQQDWRMAQKFLNQCQALINEDDFLDAINAIFIEMHNHKNKSASLAKWLSTFLPGLGQFYAQDYRNALNAFSLNSINFTNIGLLLHRAEYSGAILYFMFAAERYYTGNRYQAQQSVIKHERKKNNEYMQRFLPIIRSYWVAEP